MQLTSSLPPVEPVRFLKELEDATFRLGQPLSLYCAYSASPRVYVSWRKDGKPIWASYKYNVKTTDNSCVLEVLNSDRLEAAGRYSCEISNSENSAICYAQVKLGKTLNMKDSFFSFLILSNKNMSLSVLRMHLETVSFDINVMICTISLYYYYCI